MLRNKTPFELVYNALWEMVERHKPLAELVIPENRIRFDKNRDPVKEEISTGDLPELRLLTTGVSYHFSRASNTHTLVQTFQWAIASGELQYQYVYDVMWELVRCNARWDEVLSALTWKDKRFVLHLVAEDQEIGRTEEDLIRGINGWTALWSCTVEMYFAKTDLAGEE